MTRLYIQDLKPAFNVNSSEKADVLLAVAFWLISFPDPL